MRDKISSKLKNLKHLFIMFLLFCTVLGVFFAVRIYALPGLSLNEQTTKFNTITDSTIPNVQNGDIVTQNIISDLELQSFSILIDTRNAKNGADLTVNIQNASGEIIANATARVPYSEEEFAPYTILHLDEHVQLKYHETFAINIEVKTLGDETISFHKSENVQSSVQGELQLNGETVGGTLTMTAHTDTLGLFINAFYILLSVFTALGLCYIYAAVFIFKLSLHRTYLIVAVVFGLLYMTVIPPYGSTDEKQHINQAFNNASSIVENIDENTPFSYSFRRYADYNSVLQENYTTLFSYKEMSEGILEFYPENESDAITIYNTEIVGGYQLPYAVPTLGVLLGYQFNLGYAQVLFFARLLNYIYFVILTFFAIKITPFGKTIFAAIALFPGTLHVAASFSRDNFLLATSFLFIALCLYAANKKERIKWPELALLCSVAILLAPSKSAYIPIVLLIFIIPSSRFAKKWHALIVKFATLGASGALYWFINSGYISNVTGGAVQPYIEQAQNALAAGEITAEVFSQTVNPDLIVYNVPYILENINQFISLIINTVVLHADEYIFGIFGQTLGNNNLQLSPALILAFCAVLLLSVQCADGNELMRKKSNIFCAALAFLLCCAFVVAGSVLWTPTYYTAIYGLQGRYFLPMLPILFLLLKPLKAQIKEESANYILFAISCLHSIVVLNIFYVVALR